MSVYTFQFESLKQHLTFAFSHSILHFPHLLLPAGFLPALILKHVSWVETSKPIWIYFRLVNCLHFPFWAQGPKGGHRGEGAETHILAQCPRSQRILNLIIVVTSCGTHSGLFKNSKLQFSSVVLHEAVHAWVECSRDTVYMISLCVVHCACLHGKLQGCGCSQVDVTIEP